MQEILFKDVCVGDTVRIEYKTPDAEVSVVGVVSSKFRRSLTLGENHVHQCMPVETYYLIKRRVTVAWVQEMLEVIRKNVDDWDRARSLERELYLRVLEAVATDTCDDSRACAAESLKSQDIEF